MQFQRHAKLDYIGRNFEVSHRGEVLADWAGFVRGAGATESLSLLRILRRLPEPRLVSGFFLVVLTQPSRNIRIYTQGQETVAALGTTETR